MTEKIRLRSIEGMGENWATIMRWADAAFRERYARHVPAGRMLREDEIAGPVEFLGIQPAHDLTAAAGP